MCHGDVHPGNVAMTADGPVLLDWDLLCPAPPGWDHAMLLRAAAVGVAGALVRRLRRRLRPLVAPAIRRPMAIAELRLVAATLMRLRAGRADPAAMPEARRRLAFWRGDPDAPTWRAAVMPVAAADAVGWRADGAATCTSTRRSCRRAWRAACACRTARRSGRPGRRRCRRAGASTPCAPCSGAARAADDEFVRFMETCIQCRGCEPACPSGVPFGHLMEGTREALADAHRTAPRWLRAGFARARAAPGAARRVDAARRRPAAAPRAEAGRAGPPAAAARASASSRPARTGADAVWLYTGCVMDAWMRDTHRATAAAHRGDRRHVPGLARRVLRRAAQPTPGSATAARRLAERVMASMPGDAPIVVNSAGCGAAMKDYGHLLGTPEAAAFAARVVDVQEWLAPRDSTACRRRRAASAR